jgi:hypothetical protein
VGLGVLRCGRGGGFLACLGFGPARRDGPRRFLVVMGIVGWAGVWWSS